MASDPWKIPFVDLTQQFRENRDDWMQAIEAVVSSGRYIGGPEVRAFENEFAAYVGAKFGIGTASGSDALRLALLALGIGPGDEVATVSHTFVSTVDAIVHAGAKPVFVDIDPATFTMDPVALAKAMGPKTKAVLPVHLYGQSADMDPIAEVCEEEDAVLIEDAAQAHGAKYRGRSCGSIGRLACFSFYPAKNLGAVGDGGMITTGDAKLAERLRALREYGQTTDKYHHDFVGWNSRLDAVHAAVMRRKLLHLDAWNESRRRLAARYTKGLAGIPKVKAPVEAAGRRHVYHVYCVRSAQRDALRKHLEGQRIEAGIHYPIPVHRQRAYQKVKSRGSKLPETDRATREILSLPIYPEMPSESVDAVCEAISRWAKRA